MLACFLAVILGDDVKPGLDRRYHPGHRGEICWRDRSLCGVRNLVIYLQAGDADRDYNVSQSHFGPGHPLGLRQIRIEYFQGGVQFRQRGRAVQSGREHRRLENRRKKPHK